MIILFKSIGLHKVLFYCVYFVVPNYFVNIYNNLCAIKLF